MMSPQPAGQDPVREGEFAGLAAVVTGGSSGIGLATARLLAARGARVAALARNPAADPDAGPDRPAGHAAPDPDARPDGPADHAAPDPDASPDGPADHAAPDPDARPDGRSARHPSGPGRHVPSCTL